VTFTARQHRRINGGEVPRAASCIEKLRDDEQIWRAEVAAPFPDEFVRAAVMVPWSADSKSNLLLQSHARLREEGEHAGFATP